MSKWFLRSRKVWAVITMIAGMLGLPPEVMAAIPVLDQIGPQVQEIITLATPVALALWSAYRPDEAKLTIQPEKTNAPLKLPGRTS